MLKISPTGSQSRRGAKWARILVNVSVLLAYVNPAVDPNSSNTGGRIIDPTVVEMMGGEFPLSMSTRGFLRIFKLIKLILKPIQIVYRPHV